MDNEEEKREIAAAPAAEVKIRTMQSDLKSLQESGGQAAESYSTEIDHQPFGAAPASVETTADKQGKPEKQNNRTLLIILGILVLMLIIVLGLIWLT